MADALISGLLAGYGVAIPIGPITILIVNLASRTSLAVGFSAALGVATADGLGALLAAIGGAGLARLLRPVAVPLRWVAAAVLVALAARLAHAAWRQYRDPSRAVTRDGSALATPSRAYRGLLAMTLVNPGTVVYFAALVLGRQSSAPLSGVASALFVAAVVAASASWQILLAAGGSVLGRALTGERARFGTALASAALIVVLAIKLLVTA